MDPAEVTGQMRWSLRERLYLLVLRTHAQVLPPRSSELHPLQLSEKPEQKGEVKCEFLGDEKNRQERNTKDGDLASRASCVP